MSQPSISAWLNKQSDENKLLLPVGMRISSAPAYAPDLKARETTNWNDLPEDFLTIPSRSASSAGSRSSSRNSSRPKRRTEYSAVGSLSAAARQSPKPPNVATMNPFAHPSPPTSSSNGQCANEAFGTTAFVPMRRKSPDNVTTMPITSEWIPSFKRLNALLLPIPYPQKFYDEIVEDEVTADISVAALWHEDGSTASAYTSASQTNNDTKGMNGTGPPRAQNRPLLVAAIRCRILPTPTHEPASDRTLYISTLCTLSPYQQHGLASSLLATITARAIRKHGVTSVTAHVWEANEEALAWYAKRGFREVGKEEGYYRKLRPMGAVCLRRDVGVNDLLGFDGEQ